MRKILIGRSARILGALLAIAGSALGGRAHGDPTAAVLPGAAVELATSARLEVDAFPGERAAARPPAVDRTLRSGSAEPRVDGDVPPVGRTVRRSTADRATLPLDSAHAPPATYHHAGRLARSGAISSFGTSLPPPLSA